MITIAWDVDDVLNNLTEAWLSAQPFSPGYNTLTCNPPLSHLNISLDDFRDALDRFRAAHFADLPPNAEILAWFQQYGHRAHHIALSAVPRKFATISAAWTFTYFGDWIRSYNFIPSPRTPDTHPTYDDSKGRFLSRCGKVDILVEDNQSNAIAATELGITVCLYPQPWNMARALSVPTFLTQLTNLMNISYP